MRDMIKGIVGSAAVLSMGASAWAAPTVDGTRDAEYGSALAVQTVQTGFGDNESEWNAGYGVIDLVGGRLHLMLTGNLQTNFNKLEIFIDSKAGGQSVFDSSGNDEAGRMDGLVFDTGFTADYHLIARRGNDAGNDKFDLDFANLTAQTASSYGDVLGGNAGTGTTGTGTNAVGIGVAYDGSNTAGITGGTAAADQDAARAVTTGLELSIALADLGYVPGDSINIMVGQNGDGHHFWSNQFLGGLPTGLNNGANSGGGTGNLGGDGNGNFTGEGAIDMTALAGDQFFTVVVPEPASAAVLGLGALGALARRRRSV